MYIEGKSTIEKSATKDEITIRVTVVEVENGYVVQKNVSGRRPAQGSKEELPSDGKEWFEESVSYITTENPFKDEEDKDIKLPSVSGLLDMSASLTGKLKVG